MSEHTPHRDCDFALAVCCPMVGWLALYAINDSLPDSTEWAAGIDWVFLPAAARLISILVFGPAAALGLFAGSLCSMLLFEEATVARAVSIAAASALAPLLAVEIVRRCLCLNRSLSGLRAAELGMLAVGCAAMSVLLHNILYWLSSHRTDPLSGLLPMFVGDIVGTVIVFYALRSLLRAHARLSGR